MMIMKRMLITFALIWLIPTATALAQAGATKIPAWYGMEDLGEYLGLKLSDISFRNDYTEPDSFRLQIVADLMREPMGMIGYAEGLKRSHVSGQPEIIAAILFQDLIREHQSGRSVPYRPTEEELQQNYNLFYHNITLNQLLTRLAIYIDVVFPKSTQSAISRLSREQRRFLTTEFKEILVTSVDEEKMSVEQLDSLSKIEESYTEQFASFGYLIDKDPILAAGKDCLTELLTNIRALRRELNSGNTTAADAVRHISVASEGIGQDSYLGRQSGWAVGGPGNDYYKGDYKVIVDLGGDDVYDLSYDPTKPHGVIIVDLGGNDHYRSKSDFTIASGCLSVGILLDFAGNDRYDGASFGVGSGFFGMGVLYDAAGDDIYNGDTHVEGAGSFGIGVVIDEAGRDLYNSALYSQGFGFTEGYGIILDANGSDSYYAGGKYLDVLRYGDRYLSLSQGFGYGLRPWLSGGIGAIIDGEGNDNYYSEIFGQGASYWWSLGFIYDSLGNDNYQCYQYGQGCGTHMTLGALIDDAGNDVYFGKGLMQGVGHDYSCGLILDRGGDDTYTASDLSQGAGSANGAGILIDVQGNDRYFITSADNTHGYGNPRREFGSIGMFIDLAGDDIYTGRGSNNAFWRSNSKWGGGMDIDQESMKQPQSQQ